MKKSFGSLVGARSGKALSRSSREVSSASNEISLRPFSTRTWILLGEEGKEKESGCFYRSTDSDDTRRSRFVRWRGKHDKFDVRHTLQLGATSLHLLVLQRPCFELRQSQGRCLGDNRKGWRRHHVLAPYPDGATLGLRGVQLQTEQRQYGVHQSSCSKWWVFTTRVILQRRSSLDHGYNLLALRNVDGVQKKRKKRKEREEKWK